MIFLFVVVSSVVLMFLPWWTFAVFSVAFGLVYRVSWKKALQLAGTVALLEFIAAFYWDQHAHHLIGQRLGGLLSVAPWVICLLTAALGFWMAIFRNAVRNECAHITKWIIFIKFINHSSMA